MNECPICHERTDSLWHALPVEEGYSTVYRLSHRRSDGGRCTAHRGEATRRECGCTTDAEPVTILDISHSDHADARAMAG